MLLTDPAFIKKLEMLSLLARKVLNGELRADRRSTRKGSGTEFADYQEYYPGDDFRNVDWNIAARLEQLVIKLFEIEEDITFHIFLDLSHSMKSKLHYCKQLAAALGYITLHNHDRVSVYGISSELGTVLNPAHGKGRTFSMLEALQKSATYGHDTDLESTVRSFMARNRKPGFCIIISDFLSSHGYTKALDLLKHGRHDVFAIQVLSGEELDWIHKGDLELICPETQETKRVTITPEDIKAYLNLMQEWNHQLNKECRRRGIGIIQTDTKVPFEEIIQNILHRGGLIA